MFDLNFKHSNSQQFEPPLNHQNQALKDLGAITLKIYQALNLEAMLQITVTEVRQLLDCDRVLLYRLQVDGTGSTLAESVAAAYPSVLGRSFPSDVLPAELYQQYRQGYTQAIEDTEKTPLTLCPIELLQQVKVRAKLAVPILLQSELWGLLVVHQCQQPRQWSTFELELLKQLIDHLSVAVAQTQLLAAFQLHEERSTLALNSTNAGLWDWNLRTQQVYFSPQWKALLGYEEFELSSCIEEWWQRVHPQAQAQVKTHIINSWQRRRCQELMSSLSVSINYSIAMAPIIGCGCEAWRSEVLRARLSVSLVS